MCVCVDGFLSSRLKLFLYADSGVGAGIDSYYEYLMKAYILLGDNVYLERFNTVGISHTHTHTKSRYIVLFFVVKSV